MPKRTRADRDDGDIAPATRAAINRHGWEELRHAYQTGRLIFLEGVGAKVAAEMSLLLQSSPGASREPNHWERLLDLVRPHLNSEWIARLATWNESQIVDESLLKRVEAICALRPQYANSALLRSFLAAASKEVRAHLEMDQDLSWPEFNASEARARPYEYLCQNWKLPLRITDNIAIAVAAEQRPPARILGGGTQRANPDGRAHRVWTGTAPAALYEAAERLSQSLSPEQAGGDATHGPSRHWSARWWTGVPRGYSTRRAGLCKGFWPRTRRCPCRRSAHDRLPLMLVW